MKSCTFRTHFHCSRILFNQTGIRVYSYLKKSYKMTPVILFKFCICTSTRFQIIIHSLQFQGRLTASFSYWNILKAREVYCLCKFSAVANRRIKSGIVHLLEETGSVEMESYCNKFVIFVLRYLIDSILHDQEREREGGGKSSTRLVRKVKIHHV